MNSPEEKENKEASKPVITPMKCLLVCLLTSSTYTIGVTWLAPQWASDESAPFLACTIGITMLMSDQFYLNYSKLAILTFLMCIVFVITYALSWCIVVILQPDKLVANSFVPCWLPIIRVIRILLIVGALYGLMMAAFACLFKWLNNRNRPKKKHPLLNAMKP